jgi:NADH:ubiquinone reductase (non-electrogenic)
VDIAIINPQQPAPPFSYGYIHFSFSGFSQSGVRLVRGIVKDVKAQKLILNDGTEVPYGLLVWSTGVGPSPLVNSLELPKSPGGRLVTFCFWLMTVHFFIILSSI